MYFLDNLISQKTKSLRSQLINHPLWTKITDGTLPKKQLQIFALQDYWLIKQARRIDQLTIDKTQDKKLQKLLIDRQRTKNKYSGTIFDFGKGLGITENDFKNVNPIAGCMGITTFFFWMIDYSSDYEKVAAIFASVAVFSDICMRVHKPLQKHYKLTEKEVGFFSGHKYSEGKVKPISSYIEKHCKTNEDKKLVDQAVRLSYSFEKLFYDAIVDSKAK